MDFKNFQYTKGDGVGAIMLCRPEKLNALTAEIWDEVGQVLDLIEKDEAVGSVLLCGQGKSFCAGFDLAQSTAHGNAEVWEQWDSLQAQRDIQLKMWDFPKPIVCAVQGYCLGGGFELAGLADLVVAARDATFGETEIRYSLLGQPNNIWLLGIRQAKEIMMLGEHFSAEEAHRIGFVNRVVPAEELFEHAHRMAEKLAKMPGETLRMLKRLLNKSVEAQGFKIMGDWGWDMFLLSKLMVTKSRKEFNRIAEEQGMKAAFAWSNERFGD